MAVQGNKIKFTYVDGTSLPATTDADTVYFIPGVGLYVGNVLISDKTEVDLSEIETAIEELQDNQISVEVVGTGTDVLDVTFDDTTNTLTVTRGDNGYLVEADLAPYAQSADVTQEIAEAIEAIPDPPVYTMTQAATPTQGSQATYQMTKDGTVVGVNIEIPNAVTQSEYTIAETTTTSGYAKTYSLTKDGTEIGAKINIPKDLVVTAGKVKVVTQADDPYSGAKPGDKYIDLTLNDANEDHIYIPVNDLVDTYTAGTGITISNTNEIAVDTTVIPTIDDVEDMIEDAALRWQVV